jgi:hypothetical protein
MNGGRESAWTGPRTNPNGIESISPGLRGTSYPGNPPPTRINPERVASPGDQYPAAAIRCALIQPFQGWRFGWVGRTQGSFVGDETTLGWMMERRWRSRRALRAAPFHDAVTTQSPTNPARFNDDGAIPKGLNHPAQGCPPRATLGTVPRRASTLKGLNPIVRSTNTNPRSSPRWRALYSTPLGLMPFSRDTQGRRCAPTLRWMIESLRDSFAVVILQ